MLLVLSVYAPSHISDPFFQLKVLDDEGVKRSRDLAEVQARLSLYEQREEEARRDGFSLKQKLLETESGREAARKEVSAGPYDG